MHTENILDVRNIKEVLKKSDAWNLNRENNVVLLLPVCGDYTDVAGWFIAFLFSRGVRILIDRRVGKFPLPGTVVPERAEPARQRQCQQ